MDIERQTDVDMLMDGFEKYFWYIRRIVEN
jgi:hypothetical protein